MPSFVKIDAVYEIEYFTFLDSLLLANDQKLNPEGLNIL